MLFCLAALRGNARAQTITEFPIPSPTSGPESIIAGPDGAMWFAETKSGLQKFGRITTAGAITEFPFATGRPLWPRGMALGSDGALWFTVWAGNSENNLEKIGRITTAGAVSLFDLGTFTLPLGIIAGPDGALWFTEAGKIGRITTSGMITEFPIPSPDTSATSLALGTDGAFWFTVPSVEGFAGGNKIGRITTAGAITFFAIPTAGSRPQGIAPGPDGALWFCENNGNKIGRISTAGAITEFPLLTSGAGPAQIAAGPDGALWFTESLVGKIGRITTAGVVTEFAIAGFSPSPAGIAAGPDGAIWFTEESANKIGRITTANGGGGGGGNLPNLVPFTPTGWSDKIVVAKAPGSKTDATPLAPTDTLYVSWAVINSGAASVGARFYVEMYVDGVLKGTWYADPPLDSNFYVYVEDVPIGSLAAGSHTIRIKADSTAAIAESSETDNEYTKTITVGGAGCVANATTLCLNANRFAVTADWQSGTSSGTGTAVPLVSDTGAFWFFSAGNYEVMVKVVNGCSFNSFYWVFAGGLTNVKVTMKVKDTATGLVQVFENPLNAVYQAIQATAAFPCP